MPPIPFAAVTHYAAAVGRIRLPVCIILRLLRVPLLLHILPQSETHLRNANFPVSHGRHASDGGGVRLASAFPKIAVRARLPQSETHFNNDQECRKTNRTETNHWTLGPVRLGPWTFGPLDLWTFGPLDLWPLDLWTFWTFGPLDLWTLGPLDPWTFGPLNLWTSGPMDLWTLGPWTFNPLDLWTFGPLDLWT